MLLCLKLSGETEALLGSGRLVVRKVGGVCSQQRQKYLCLPETGRLAGLLACTTPGGTVHTGFYGMLGLRIGEKLEKVKRD